MSASDRGLLMGEGVYETCAVLSGQPFALGRHVDRLFRSAAIVGLPMRWSRAEIGDACRAVLDAAGAPERCDGDGSGDDPTGRGPGGGQVPEILRRLRITVTGGPGPIGPSLEERNASVIVHVAPSVPWPPTATAVTVPWATNEHSPSVGAKTTSRLDLGLALREAHRLGVDEAVLVNTAGHLVEGTGSNIFLEVEGSLHTPSLSTGCLPGVTRGLVAELVPVVERSDLTVADLLEAEEAFLTSSTRHVHPLRSLDDRPFRSTPGPLTEIARRALAALQARTLDP